jgi:hypothetical protein
MAAEVVGVSACRLSFQDEIPLGATVLTPRRLALPHKQRVSGEDDGAVAGVDTRQAFDLQFALARSVAFRQLGTAGSRRRRSSAHAFRRR